MDAEGRLLIADFRLLIEIFSAESFRLANQESAIKNQQSKLPPGA